jgi:hypothetical protein
MMMLVYVALVMSGDGNDACASCQLTSAMRLMRISTQRSKRHRANLKLQTADSE